jgi:ectoine hydroxylase-related dioxygenase (phytanoyl-CoA dioxygenase family)
MTVAASVQRASADPPLEEWISRFHRDGFLVVEDALSPDLVAELRSDLDRAVGAPANAAGRVEIEVRMFERSAANVRLFDHEPIVSFAEQLISQDRPGLGPDHVHVVHNNAFRTPPGAGISTWHQDEPPHYLVTHGEPPTNVRLPVLLFICNYYLTDVTDITHGPTQFVPGSHLFGAHCPSDVAGTRWENDVVTAYGRAGTAIMFSCQVWHRGHPNQSERTRYVTQVSYAHRIIGHRYFPFMNYTMPEHVYAGASPRLRRLLGFLPTGAYG